MRHKILIKKSWILEGKVARYDITDNKAATWKYFNMKWYDIYEAYTQIQIMNK